MVEFIELPEEYIQQLQPILNLLKKCGISFFDKNLSWYSKTVRPIAIKAFVSAYSISLTVYLLRIFRGSMDMYELAYVFSMYTACFQAILRGINTMTKRNKLKLLILKLGAICRTENLTETQIKKKCDIFRKMKISYIASYRVTVVVAWQYMLAPLVQTFFQRLVLNEDRKMLLPFACSFPFDIHGNWFLYAVAYIFEIYSMNQVIYYYLSSETLMITITGLLSTEFVLLQEDFLNAKPKMQEQNNEYELRALNAQYGLKHMIRRHQKLLKLTETLDDVFNALIFVNLTSVTVVICFYAVAAKVARSAVDMVNNFFAVCAMMVPLFNLCYFGELLRQSSTGIADAAYNSVWHKRDKDYKKCIWFIIRRAQLPSSLTSLKYIQISLGTFSTVLSTSWSYFSLASSLYDDNTN